MRRTVIFILVFLTLVTLSCKTTRSTTNVINGVEDKDGKYPAVLNIFMKDIHSNEYSEDINSDDWSGCSSSVISSNTLLTAAHCVADAISHENGQRVKSGEIKVKLPSGKLVKAKDFYANDKYLEYYDNLEPDRDDESDLKYDVGIVVFEDNTFEGIPPLKISNKAVKEGDKLQLVGYSCQTKLGPAKEVDDPNRKILIPLDVCKDIGTDRNGHIRRYGTSVVRKNNRCPVDTIEIMTALANANYNPEDRVDPVGVSSAQWFGDSGGPTLLYDNQNLIVAMPAIVIGDGEGDQMMTGTCDNTFNPEIIKWLKHINDTTDAVIPMDEIK